MSYLLEALAISKSLVAVWAFPTGVWEPVDQQCGPKLRFVKEQSNDRAEGDENEFFLAAAATWDSTLDMSAA
jgi:hypothetical protein